MTIPSYEFRVYTRNGPGDSFIFLARAEAELHHDALMLVRDQIPANHHSALVARQGSGPIRLYKIDRSPTFQEL